MLWTTNPKVSYLLNTFSLSQNNHNKVPFETLTVRIFSTVFKNLWAVFPWCYYSTNQGLTRKLPHSPIKSQIYLLPILLQGSWKKKMQLACSPTPGRPTLRLLHVSTTSLSSEALDFPVFLRSNWRSSKIGLWTLFKSWNLVTFHKILCPLKTGRSLRRKGFMKGRNS